jgi:hypothetical protein
MSILLTLTSDYVDKMMNPIYGITVNEDYGIKFANLLESDGFTSKLNEEIESLDDANSLSHFGWIWLFEWANSKGIKLNEDLLVEQFYRWSNPIVKAEIIKIGIHGASYEINYSYTLANFPDKFLAKIMNRLTSQDFGDDLKNEKFEKDITKGTMASDVLVSFLQEGSTIVLDAAISLLKHQWSGQRDLVDFFGILLDNLDSETRDAWEERLKLPPGFRN